MPILWATLAILFVVIFIAIPEWRLPAGIAVIAFVSLFAYVVITRYLDARHAAEQALAEPLRWRPTEATAVVLEQVRFGPLLVSSAFSQTDVSAVIVNRGGEPITAMAVTVAAYDCPNQAAPLDDCSPLAVAGVEFHRSIASNLSAAVSGTVRFDVLLRPNGVARFEAMPMRVRF